MTRPNTTHIAIVLDSSGSMAKIRDDTIGGFNAFLEKQQAVPNDRATFTLVRFSNHVVTVHDFVPLFDVPPLTPSSYTVGGMTALFDAIGHTIYQVGKHLSNMSEAERPAKVVVAVITDGMENASREYQLGVIKEMVEHQERIYGWEFVFMGADLSAMQQAGEIGVRSATAMKFASTSGGVRGMMISLGDNVSNYRVTEDRGHLGFTPEQRAAADEKQEESEKSP